MAAGKGFGQAQVKHHAAPGLGLEFFRLQHLHCRSRRDGPHATGRIDLLHVPEIRWARNALVPLGLHELRAWQGEDGVVVALQAQRGMVALGNVAAAHRPGAVRRQHDGLVAQRHQLGVYRVVQLASMHRSAFRVGQVGAPGLANEQGVARENRPGGVGRVGQVHRVAHALRRVPGGMQSHQCNALGKFKPFAVGQPDVAMPETRVPPIDHLGAALAHQLGRPHHEVLLPVGFQHVLDRHLVLARQGQVLVHVPPRVHQGRLAGIANQVGHMGNARGFDAFEDHGPMVQGSTQTHL